MSDPIELRGLTKHFGSVPAVADVTLAVAAGEFLTLLGPSGCGKTTLLRLLSGFEQPSAGSIIVGGVDVTARPPHRRDINQVFQSYALFPHLTVRDNIAFGLRMQGLGRGVTAGRVAEAIALVSLAGLEARYPHQLSGGQRQRVALARAIVPRPRVLLLDEPLSALDAKLRREMQVELRRLQRRVGVTTILVTHDQEEALAMSDRVAVMNAGRIEQLGTGEEIYHRPQTPFVAAFLGESNLLAARVVGIRDEEIDLQAGAGWRVTLPRRGPGAFELGEERVISVRPERLKLHREAPAGNAIRGRVTEKTFLGPAVRLTVETDAQQRLTVLSRATDANGTLGWDGAVYCTFDPAEAVLLTAAPPIAPPGD